MNTKLKIESQIYTHSNDRFLSVHFNCDHNYYIGGICTDLALELTKASKELLKANNIFIKENGHSLLIGRKKKSIEGNEVFNSTLSSPLPIFIQLKVTNSRFWSVTDFNLLKASKNVFKLETPLIFQYEDKEEIMECSSKELTSEDQKKYDLRNFPKEIFGILILDLNKVSKNKMNLKLKLEAPEVKLKYKVIIPNGKTKKSNKTGKRLTIDDILGNKKVLRESSFKEENKLELTVKKIRDFYIVESVKNWSMRQENLHQNSEFFKFEVEVDDSEKANENKAEVLLPFPSRIKPNLFKKEDGMIILEQEVSLLRFSAKPGPKQ